jgi:hypothetical protein
MRKERLTEHVRRVLPDPVVIYTQRDCRSIIGQLTQATVAAVRGFSPRALSSRAAHHARKQAHEG